ncbi:nitroreductase family protein [Chloroflexota bacterium]
MASSKASRLQLPLSHEKGLVSVEEAIARRRSLRDFKDESLDLLQLSQVLWAAMGVTSPHGFRATPRAGATYPLELFVVVGSQAVGDLT